MSIEFICNSSNGISWFILIFHLLNERWKRAQKILMYMCIQYCFNSYLFHIKYQIKGTREKLNFELRQLKCLAKRRTLQLKLSPRTFLKDNVSSSCADNIWRNQIHTRTYIYRIKYIVISSFSHYLAVLLTCFSLQSCRLILSRCHLSLPSLRLWLLFKCKCAEMSLMFLNILHCSLAPVVDSGLTAWSSYRCACLPCPPSLVSGNPLT